MVSRQSEAIRRHRERARSAMIDPAAPQPDDGSWRDLTAEPREVDYIEVDAAGLPARWAVPKGRADDRALLFMHGGAFISGSIHSHRKLYAHPAKASGTRALIVDCSLAPAHTHPIQVDEATRLYRWLREQGFSPGVATKSPGVGLSAAGLERRTEPFYDGSRSDD